MSTVNIPGFSGLLYAYDVYSISSPWNDVPGNYVFAGQQGGIWQLLYVGQCDSFSERIPSHERWAEAVQRGATHVLAQTNTAGEPARLAQERDIIGRHQPPMNVQHRAA